MDEGKNVLSFFEEGCGCSKWNGKNCIHQFSQAHVSELTVLSVDSSGTRYDGFRTTSGSC